MTKARSKANQLTVKKGILAIVIMYAGQLLAGIAVSYGFKFFLPALDVPLDILGLTSALLSGIMIITFFSGDIRRSGQAFYSEIGLQPIKIKKGKALLLVLAALTSTHFLAWVYRSVILPSYGFEGVIGGGSKMFSFIQTNGGTVEMGGFLMLALLVGPIMEEIVFRGYLQSSLANKIPAWAAIVITSLVFTIGHSPMLLWPMYFLYSVTWGWVYLLTGSLKMAILIHILSNLFYTVIGFAGWDILA
ncbi:MAG: CPBP family intramembrane glutamic endopeptidase [Vicingaceae bacterium]